MIINHRFWPQRHGEVSVAEDLTVKNHKVLLKNAVYPWLADYGPNFACFPKARCDNQGYSVLRVFPFREASTTPLKLAVQSDSDTKCVKQQCVIQAKKSLPRHCLRRKTGGAPM